MLLQPDREPGLLSLGVILFQGSEILLVSLNKPFGNFCVAMVPELRRAVGRELLGIACSNGLCHDERDILRIAAAAGER